MVKAESVFLKSELVYFSFCFVEEEGETMPAAGYREIPEKVGAERRVWTSCRTEVKVINNLSSPETASGSVQKPKCRPIYLYLKADLLPDGLFNLKFDLL